MQKIELSALLLAGAVVIAGCGRSEPTGYASPDEAFAAMHDAVAAKDWETFAGCLTPECRTTQAGAMVMMAGFMALDAEIRPELEEILKQHGLDEAEDPKAKGPLKTEVDLTYEKPWGSSDETESNLSATVMLSGKPVAEATAFGFVQLDLARDDKGKSLKEVKNDAGFMDPMDETERFQIRGPGSTEDITLTLEQPSPDATALAILEGSLKLMTGGQCEKIYIDGIAGKKPGDMLQHPTLKAAGATAMLVDEPYGDPEEGTTAVDVRTSGPVREIDLVDSDGSPVAAATGFGGGTKGGIEYISRQFTRSGNLPSDWRRLELEVFLDQKPLLVPFKFENVPLPSEQQEDEGQSAEEWPFEGDPKEMAEPIKDKIAFIAQMMAVLDKISESQARFPGKGKLAGLKIDGDTATAVVVTTENGTEQKEPIEFRRIDDGWFIQFPEGYSSM